MKKEKMKETCQMCEDNHKPICFVVNRLKICTDCANFEIKRARMENNTPLEQIYIDAEYMMNNPINKT